MTDETPEVYLSRARLLLDLDRWSEAGEELAQARALDPANVDVLALSALVATQEGHAAEALTYAAAATTAAPQHEEALIIRAWVLTSVGEREAATKYAGELFRNFSDSAYPVLVAAALFSVVGGGQVALDAAWLAVRLAPEDPDAHWVLSRIAARMGLEEIAMTALADARRHAPLPQRRSGVWKLWWERYGGVDSPPP
jgi:tetratricopeptide (TPR) repeat protein